MKDNKRYRQQELIDALQQRVGTPEYNQLVELLTLCLEEVQREFVTCSPADFQRLQGEAQVYDNLVRMLKRPSIKTITLKE